jgi:hypothetical protein
VHDFLGHQGLLNCRNGPTRTFRGHGDQRRVTPPTDGRLVLKLTKPF